MKLSAWRANLQRGDRLRIDGTSPSDDHHELMIAETLGEPTYSLWVTSGYKAGLVLWALPMEANGEPCGIDLAWAKQNLVNGLPWSADQLEVIPWDADAEGYGDHGG